MRQVIWNVATMAALFLQIGMVHALPASFNNVTITTVTPDGNIIIRGEAAKSPKIFAAEMFGQSGIVIPETDHLGVVYTIDGVITEPFEIIFTLDEGAGFASIPELFLDAGSTPPDIIYRGLKREKATFQIKTNSVNKLVSGNRIFLAYQIKNTGVLATRGKEIRMNVALETLIGKLISPARSVTIAGSKQGTSFKILSEEPVGKKVHISVEDEKKRFIEESGAFVDKLDEVILGYLIVNDAEDGDNVFASNGLTKWKIGETSDAQVLSATSLTIEGGQFAASTELPGRVYIQEAGVVGATITEQDEQWTARLNLTDTMLQALARETKINGKVAIRMKVDGITEINLVDEPPTATLVIDYENTSNIDVRIDSVALQRFSLDGTVCLLPNIPGANAGDIPNIRITNDSNRKGDVYATMTDQEGNVIIPSDGSTSPVLVCTLPLHATCHLNLMKLEEFAGGPWSQRGVLEMTSSLPKIEVFVLLRDKVTGIVSNMSLGTQGQNCYRK